MKNFIIAGLMFTSLNTFSQSYMILNNGVTLTVDKAGYIYDFGHFRLPYEVTITGGQFLVEDDRISTVDKNGYLYEKAEKIKKIKGKGFNYLIDKKNDLLTVSEEGFVFKYEDKILKKARLFGGNYFITKRYKDNSPGLYVITSKGSYFRVDLPGLNPESLGALGGNYFQMLNGTLYTVSKDGFVYSKPEIKSSFINKAGGNFFINFKKELYTISEDGVLILPSLPSNLVIEDIKKLGANYMIDSQGRIFVVDQSGNVLERKVNYDLNEVKLLSR